MSLPENVVNLDRILAEKRRQELRRERRARQRKLLYETHAIVILPELATEIGLPAAAVIQQLWYWTRKKQAKAKCPPDLHEVEIYHSPEEWLIDFPFWSIKTIERAIKALESTGLIEVDRSRKVNGERVWFFRLRVDLFDSRLRDVLQKRAVARRESRKELATNRRFKNHSGVGIWKPVEDLKRRLKREGISV